LKGAVSAGRGLVNLEMNVDSHAKGGGEKGQERMCARAVRVKYLLMIILSYQISGYGYQASAS